MDHQLTLDDFELGKLLGCGQFGQVWLVKEKTRGYILALKIVEKRPIKRLENARPVRREIENHVNLKHPNILQMYGYFHDSQRIYMVLEYASNGELWALLNKKLKFDEKDAARYFYETAKAINYMHRMGVIHRDIKPENILLTSDNKIKIADFGMSVKDETKNRLTYCGTFEYLSKEMMTEGATHDHTHDVWCLGILCFELVVGRTPFGQCKNNKTLLCQRIESREYTFPEHVSNDARDLINKLLVVDKDKRMALDDIPAHPWICTYISKCEREGFYAF